MAIQYHLLIFSATIGAMKKLVIAEKPSVGREIARNLVCPIKEKGFSEGPSYIVTWALGHLVELCEPQHYSERYRRWSLDTLPMLPETLDEMVGIATEHDCSCVIHAIGDGAIHMVLSSYEKILKDGKNPLRHGIVHCQIMDHTMPERFRANDILALVQPIFLHYDMTVVEDRVGKELASTGYAFETLRRLGVHESFGTDSPVEDMNAINNLYCAVTRKNLSGEPADGFYPGECMDIYDAVDAYTYESAYASFEEGVKGRLKPGYYADMVVLSRDIFTIPADDIIHTKVDATIVDGRFVYEA